MVVVSQVAQVREQSVQLPFVSMVVPTGQVEMQVEPYLSRPVWQEVQVETVLMQVAQVESQAVQVLATVSSIVVWSEGQEVTQVPP